MHRIWSSFPLKLTTTLLLLCGLVVTFVIFFKVYGEEQQAARAVFDRRAQFRVMAVRQGVTDAIEALQVVNQLFVTNGSVSREQFHIFTQPLRKRHPFVEAFAYLRLVSRDERPAFEAQMRTRYPGYTIDESVDGKRVVAAVKDRYSVIDYREPMSIHEPAFGLDVSVGPFQDAIQRAGDTALPSATGLFQLVKDRGEQPGFRILIAVYKGGIAPGDIGSRRLGVVGYTVAVLRARELFEVILKSAGSRGTAGLDIRVYAAASANESKLAYAHASAAPRHRPRFWSDSLIESRPLSFAGNFDVAGTAWHMVISAQPEPFIAAHPGSLFALLASLLSTFAASAYLHSVAVREQNVKQLVAQRTDELNQVNELLIEDIKIRKNVEKALLDSELMLRKLADYQERLKEDERKRIAREIHDDLGQNLLVLRIDVSMMAALVASTDSVTVTKKWIEIALNQIDITIKSVRAIINELRPAALDLGLHAAVKWQLKEFERRSGIACELHIDHEEFSMEDNLATALFRVVQESLANIMRHAQASHVLVEIQKKDRRLILTIADNGIGISAASGRNSGSFGLIGIEERIRSLGGEFSIASSPGQGVEIKVSVPL
ncbi:MAG: CHASE domain-containing protein [Burkholderiaceae bacterium]